MKEGQDEGHDKRDKRDKRNELDRLNKLDKPVFDATTQGRYDSKTQ